MYRMSVLIMLRKRPLETLGGMMAILRGVWGTMWPGHVHTSPVLDALLIVAPIEVWGLSVAAAGVAQILLIWDRKLDYGLRVAPVLIQIVTTGYILAMYFRYDVANVTTAFYLSMWLNQVWIWGDLRYERRINAAD